MSNIVNFSIEVYWLRCLWSRLGSWLRLCESVTTMWVESSLLLVMLIVEIMMERLLKMSLGRVSSKYVSLSRIVTEELVYKRVPAAH